MVVVVVVVSHPWIKSSHVCNNKEEDVVVVYHIHVGTGLFLASRR